MYKSRSQMFIDILNNTLAWFQQRVLAPLEGPARGTMPLARCPLSGAAAVCRCSSYTPSTGRGNSKAAQLRSERWSHPSLLPSHGEMVGLHQGSKNSLQSPPLNQIFNGKTIPSNTPSIHRLSDKEIWFFFKNMTRKGM